MGGLQSLERLENVYGASFKETDFWGMVDHVRNAGHGARGIVAANPGGGMPGHVFNIMNDQNRVLFIDAQTGFVDPTYFQNIQADEDELMYTIEQAERIAADYASGS